MPSIGKSIPHDSSRGHVTGEALYLDDAPPQSNELIVDFVGSPIARGRLLAVDLTAARAVEGVVGLYTAQDLEGCNRFGAIVADEPFLVEEEISYLGEPIVILAGESRAAVDRAKQAVQISVREERPILTIEEAIQAGSFLTSWREFRRGDVEQALREADLFLEGTLQIGGQEHLYLESQAAIAHPAEEDRLVIHSSTQNPTEIQHVVGHVLGLGMHQVVCICKRMGGGFGGKETQAALPALMAGLVALKTRRPARMIYSRDADMRFTGKRHPYRADYRVGFNREGRIEGLQIEFHSNGGSSTDLSPSVMDRTLFHADNAYYLPNALLRGRVCRTNLPSNTAFRGFGGPQAVAAVENILEEIAFTLGRDAFDVRRINCYGVEDRNVTPYGQTVENNLLPDLFDRLAESSDYRRRMKEIQEFNARSRTHARGLSLTPVKFGISFTTKFLNQGNALVNVYTDGTVQVSTGGTEMGQGLNTKIRQLVADVFGLEPDRVMMMPTSTEKNNNTSPTAASAGTDLNGSAAVQAAEKIRDRMAELAKRTLIPSGAYLAEAGSEGSHPPTPSLASERGGASILPSPERRARRSREWGEVVFAEGRVFDRDQPEASLSFAELAALARRERVDLGERAFYATPDLDFDPILCQGRPFFYYTQGCAVSEVTVDRWTGEITVERVDLLMDIGQSINPGIDLGQIVGGFVQGMGWVTTEELVYSPQGELLSASPTTYKIPGSLEIPQVFRIDLFDNPHNTRNIRASKAVGEPPLLLAVSVWTAVKHALSFLCRGAIPDLSLPATHEQVLLCIERHSKEEPEALAVVATNSNGNGRRSVERIDAEPPPVPIV